MELEEQLCNRELAKKLKELGVKQESHFYHTRISDTPDGKEDWLIRNSSWGKGALEECSAFTVAELGEMLPTAICDPEQKLSKTPRKCFSLWQKAYDEDYIDNFVPVEFAIGYGDTQIKEREKTEANARAKMLIYLIENKLTSVPPTHCSTNVDDKSSEGTNRGE